jgi:hypothetical protein
MTIAVAIEAIKSVRASKGITTTHHATISEAFRVLHGQSDYLFSTGKKEQSERLDEVIDALLIYMESIDDEDTELLNSLKETG